MRAADLAQVVGALAKGSPDAELKISDERTWMDPHPEISIEFSNGVIWIVQQDSDVEEVA